MDGTDEGGALDAAGCGSSAADAATRALGHLE
jgi:hypothetical protein